MAIGFVDDSSDVNVLFDFWGKQPILSSDYTIQVNKNCLENERAPIPSITTPAAWLRSDPSIVEIIIETASYLEPALNIAVEM
ncbi:hypothetical protein J6590_040134 [Homalodisca vitripennis]|nr:hypothetical protein J6590_040134 [Homalodisca vitripennis]